MGFFTGVGNALGGLGHGLGGGAGGLGRGLGDVSGAAGDAAGAAGRGLGGAAGGAAGDAGGAAGRGLGGAGGGAAGDAGGAAGKGAKSTTPVDTTIPPGTPERRAAAADPNNPGVPSREGGSSFFRDLKPGDVWKPLVALTVVGAAVTITALMLDKANQGAQNDGKTYNIKLLKNKGSTGTTVTCQFSPSVDPNGVVVGDSITISGTGTPLDGNDYTITKKTASHSSLEFDAGSRLSADVKDKGSFVLHTSFENQMDNQAKDLGGGVGGFFSNLFQGIFGGVFGDSAGMVGIGCVVCSFLIICIVILLLVSKVTSK
jgi:hypothetical protein